MESFNTIIEILLLGMALSADCFAVSLCSSLGLRQAELRRAFARVAPAFAIIQTGLLLAGYLLGVGSTALIGEKIASVSRFIGFGLILLVSLDMIVASFKAEEKALDFTHFRYIVIGGVATSMDALAVGVSMALEGRGGADLEGQVLGGQVLGGQVLGGQVLGGAAPFLGGQAAFLGGAALSVFVFSFLAVTLGMFGGSAIGARMGRWARLAGGLILLGLARWILLR